MDEEIYTHENSSLSWKRPSGPLRVWRILESLMRTKNSARVKVSIQDIPKHRYEDVLDHLTAYYIPDEPICKSLHVKDHPAVIEDLRTEWRDDLEQGISVGAFLVGSDINKPLLVAVNVLYVGTKMDDALGCQRLNIKSPTAKIMIDKFWDILAEADVYGRMLTEIYIGGSGLCVHPLYRGYGLAKHLLDARTDIGREFGVQVSASEFTGAPSQSIADRNGFQLLLDKRYDEILDESGKVLYPVQDTKTLKVMAKRLY